MTRARATKKSPHASTAKARVIAASSSYSVDDVVALLKGHASQTTLDGMSRYGLPAEHALGVAVGTMQTLAKKIGRNHALALGLWDTGWYEARMIACFLDDPAQVTLAQMDRWCRDFDNWGIVDTVSFHLFGRTTLAWRRIEPWAHRRDEFGKRAAFALLWTLSTRSGVDDGDLLRGLELIEEAATDERHFVKKAVNMALRAIGKRNPALNAAAIVVATRLAGSQQATPRWVGRHALSELTGASVMRRLATRSR